MSRLAAKGRFLYLRSSPAPMIRPRVTVGQAGRSSRDLCRTGAWTWLRRVLAQCTPTLTRLRVKRARAQVVPSARSLLSPSWFRLPVVARTSTELGLTLPPPFQHVFLHPAPPTEMKHLAMGVLEFAKELGHTVVSPVVSSVKTLQQLAGAGTDDGETADAGAGSDATVSGYRTPDQVQEEQELELGAQSSEHVMGLSGPEVFEHPSGAGAMEDESVLLGESVRSSASSALSTAASSVPAPAAASAADAAQRRGLRDAPAQQGLEGDYDLGGQTGAQEERSLSCIQDCILPLDADSCLEGRNDMQQGGEGKMCNGVDASEANVLADAHTPHTSIADTVAHESRPSTASLHQHPHAGQHTTDVVMPHSLSCGLCLHYEYAAVLTGETPGRSQSLPQTQLARSRHWLRAAAG